jgi:hypothetical protein
VAVTTVHWNATCPRRAFEASVAAVFLSYWVSLTESGHASGVVRVFYVRRQNGIRCALAGADQVDSSLKYKSSVDHQIRD